MSKTQLSLYYLGRKILLHHHLSHESTSPSVSTTTPTMSSASSTPAASFRPTELRNRTPRNLREAKRRVGQTRFLRTVRAATPSPPSSTGRSVTSRSPWASPVSMKSTKIRHRNQSTKKFRARLSRSFRPEVLPFRPMSAGLCLPCRNRFEPRSQTPSELFAHLLLAPLTAFGCFPVPLTWNH